MRGKLPGMRSLNEQPTGLVIPQRFQLRPGDEAADRGAMWTYIVRGDLEGFDDWTAEQFPHLSEIERYELMRFLVDERSKQQRQFGRVESRLTAAFDELRECGVLTCQDFTCCQSCLHAEIADQIPETGTWDGYVAFHQQDTERLVHTNSTYLAYGVFLDTFLSIELWNALPEEEQHRLYDTTTLAMLHDRVIPVLKKHGLDVEWNGDLTQRIRITNADFYVPIDEVELPEPGSGSPDFSVDSFELAQPPQFVRNEGEGWEGYAFVVDPDDPDLTLWITYPTASNVAGPEQVAVTWRGMTEREAVVDVRGADEGEVLVLLRVDAAQKLMLPEGLFLSVPGADLTQVAREVQQRLITVGAVPDDLGEGSTVRYACEDGIENLLIAESPHGAVVFARRLNPTPQQADANEHYVGFGNDTGVWLGAVLGWERSGADSVKVTLHPDAAADLKLPEQIDFTFDPANDAEIAYRRVLQMLQESGEVDADGNFIDE